MRASPGRLTGRGHELGPFADNPLFTWDVTREIERLTGDAFAHTGALAAGFSSGVSDLQTFVSGLRRVFSLETVVSIDPNPPQAMASTGAETVRQYLSGMTSGGVGKPGSEFLPLGR